MKSARKVSIPVDPELPQLEVALDRKRMLPLLQLPDFQAPPEKCTIKYLRYKPGTNCIVLYRVKLRDGQRTWAYAKLFSTTRKPRPSDQVRLSRYYPDHRLAIAVFPRDLQIPSLSLLRERDAAELLKGVVSRQKMPRFETQLGDWTPVRYKPERRCVLKGSYETKDLSTNSDSNQRVFYARFYADQDSHQIASWYKHFSELESSAVLLPQFIGYGRRRRLLLLRRLRGRPLWNILRRSGSEWEQAVSAAAKALAAWHQLDPPAGASTQQINPSLMQTAGTLETLLPDCHFSVTELAEEWIRTAPVTIQNSLLHGDFYFDQILLKKNGSAALLDLDRLSVGDPASDLATFCSHLHLLTLRGKLSPAKAEKISERLLEEYSGLTQGMTEKRIQWYLGVSLFVLSLTPFRDFSKRWPELTSRMLDESVKKLEAHSC